MFVYNLFLKNCMKVEQQTYDASVYIMTAMPTRYVTLGYTTQGSPSITAEPARYVTLGCTASQVC